MASFAEYFDSGRVPGLRRTALLVTFGAVSFALVDPIFGSQNIELLLAIRFGLAVLAMGIFALTFYRPARASGTLRGMSYVLTFCSGVGVALLTQLTGGANSPYWAMELVVFFGTTFLLRFTTIEATVLFVGVLASYDLMLLANGEKLATVGFVTSNAGMVLGIFVSAVAGGYLHALIRKEFEAQQALSVANEELKKSVSELAFKKEQAEVRFLQDKLWFAHDLHDTVGSQLAQMSVLAGKTDSRSITHLAELAQGTLENVRNFAHVLKGEQRVDDLNSQLWKLEQSLRVLGRYRVSYIPERHPSRVSDLMLLHVDRILSEWTANVIRHSGADAVAFGTRSHPGILRVWFYQNNGGFTWRGAAERGGLRSIESRAQNIGAQASVRRRGKGAFFVLTIKTGQ